MEFILIDWRSSICNNASWWCLVLRHPAFNEVSAQFLLNDSEAVNKTPFILSSFESSYSILRYRGMISCPLQTFIFHTLLPSRQSCKDVFVTMETGFVGSTDWFSYFLCTLIDFSEAGELPTQQLSLFVNTSAHLACHFQWMFIPSVGGEMMQWHQWKKAFLTAATSNTDRSGCLRVSMTLCTRRYMYNLTHSSLQREAARLRWWYGHWCLPVWPRNVKSGACLTYFGGHVASGFEGLSLDLYWCEKWGLGEEQGRAEISNQKLTKQAVYLLRYFLVCSWIAVPPFPLIVSSLSAVLQCVLCEDVPSLAVTQLLAHCFWRQLRKLSTHFKQKLLVIIPRRRL